jgi:uncharacterized protein YoxC
MDNYELINDMIEIIKTLQKAVLNLQEKVEGLEKEMTIIYEEKERVENRVNNLDEYLLYKERKWGDNNG